MAFPTQKSLANLKSFSKGGYTIPGGDKLAGRRQQLRFALAKAVSKEDVREIALALIEQAKAGNVHAAHEIFDRVLGKATQPVEMTGKDGGPIKVEDERLAGLPVDDLEHLRRISARLASDPGTSGN